MLHVVYQRHNIPPDEVYAKESRHRAVMYASDMLVLEEEARERTRAERQRGSR